MAYHSSYRRIYKRRQTQPTRPGKKFRRTTRYRHMLTRSGAYGYYPQFKKPGRFGTNYATYRKTKRMSKSMTNFAETIYNPLTAVDEQTPTASVGTTKTYYLGYTLGNTVPTGWTNYNALGSMTVGS